MPRANIGVPTGKASALLVLDVDPDRGGRESLAILEREIGELPCTYRVQTGGGGEHIYFRYPRERVGCSAGLLGPALDVRGEGGYIVAPPSRTTAPYVVLDRSALAEPPAWLLDALRDEPTDSTDARETTPVGPGKNQPMSAELDGPQIAAGGRNEGLTRIAGRLRARGAGDGELLETLERINAARCVPPLPAREVNNIARSASRWKIGTSRPGPDPETVADLERVAAGVEAGDWRGMGGRTRKSVMVSLIKIAREHGEKIPAGVRLSISVRALALAAAVSLPTAQKAIRRLRESGYLRRDDRGRSGTEAGALVLVAPRAKVTHSTSSRESIEEKRKLVCNPCAPPPHPYSAPRLRWSAPEYHREHGERIREMTYRLGKTAEAILDALEAAGGVLTLAEIAAALGVARPRDLLRRDGPLVRLQAAAVVECSGHTVSLAADWSSALEDERERAGEISAYRRDMARYARETEAYRGRHGNPADYSPTEAGMDKAREERDRRHQEARQRPVSPLAEAMRDYLQRNPHHADEPAGWVGSTLWAYQLYDGKPTPAESKHALEELGPDFLEGLTRARVA
jgi:putative DNA primase/helicase